jgi:predicted ATPase
MDSTNERWFQAEMERTSGEFLLLAGRSSEAEDSFVSALAIAQRQEALWWELRAANSLARLWEDRGDHQKARDLLAPVLGRFTEGFGTADLKVAKALLDELHR